jgi:hypothetical protein
MLVRAALGDGNSMQSFLGPYDPSKVVHIPIMAAQSNCRKSSALRVEAKAIFARKSDAGCFRFVFKAMKCGAEGRRKQACYRRLSADALCSLDEALALWPVPPLARPLVRAALR